MALNQQAPINALAIRDTNDHNSDTVFNGDLFIKTLVIENGLNQAVTLQCEGSAHSDFSNYFLIGSEWAVPANTNIYATCDSYIPYWRVVATCASAPTSGSLTVIIFGVH